MALLRSKEEPVMLEVKREPRVQHLPRAYHRPLCVRRDGETHIVDMLVRHRNKQQLRLDKEHGRFRVEVEVERHAREVRADTVPRPMEAELLRWGQYRVVHPMALHVLHDLGRQDMVCGRGHQGVRRPDVEGAPAAEAVRVELEHLRRYRREPSPTQADANEVDVVHASTLDEVPVQQRRAPCVRLVRDVCPEPEEATPVEVLVLLADEAIGEARAGEAAV
uniref:Uncharacterized protein n=1 Tax=Triticum urartu TaxID=4572 RepID=A0A8R7TDH4_TRIUA